jgi:predicted amidohydrolase
MQTLRAASVQFQHADNDKRSNFAKLEHFVSEAAHQGVELIAFPECCLTGYWFLRNLTKDQVTELSEPVPTGPSTQRLLSLSKHHNITIGAGLIERDEHGLMYNTYVVAMPNGKYKRHRKIHAFEHDHITPGHEYTVFDTPHGCRVGVLICYDNNIIENVRITALMGAEVLLAPHQTGGCNSLSPHGMKPIDRKYWDNRHTNPKALEAQFRGDKGRAWILRWLPSRAHDNGMFLVFSNGVGPDDDELRTGNAMILDPYGRIVSESTKCCDDMITTTLDASLLEKCTGRRWMQARRPDLYTPLTIPTGQERSTRAVRFDK